MLIAPLQLECSGIAVSGGGLRASLFAAGTVAAFDSRNSTNAGGLLQLADYFSGLSGGSWGQLGSVSATAYPFTD